MPTNKTALEMLIEEINKEIRSRNAASSYDLERCIEIARSYLPIERFHNIQEAYNKGMIDGIDYAKDRAIHYKDASDYFETTYKK